MNRREFISDSAIIVSSFTYFPHLAFSEPIPELVNFARDLARKGRLEVEDLEQIRLESKKYTTPEGKVTPRLQDSFFEIEKLRPLFSAKASSRFQTMVAETFGRMKGEIKVPEHNTSFWLLEEGKLEGFRSSPTLPKKADYVVIGAGLTGASLAKHLAPNAAKGEEVVVLEMGTRPASGASGKNGGNIEAMKENFLDDYRGFVKVQEDFIRARYPDLPPEVVEFQAKRQAKILLEFSRDNVKIMKGIIMNDGVQADASFDGWLRIADSKKEAEGLKEEVEFAKTVGLKFEIWSPERIKKETGIESKYPGRFIQDSGNYNPAKFTEGVFQKAIDQGVKLYTGVETTKVEPQKDGSYLVHTKDGTIQTRKVIVATNAFTRDIFPELTFIEPRVSHILNFEHVRNLLKRGITVTTKQGDLYWNFPKAKQYLDALGIKYGMVHIGGGADTPFAPELVRIPPFLEMIFHQVRREAGIVLPILRDQPPVRAWSGPMAFTEDRMPVISFYTDQNGKEHKGIVLAVAFNGYGGSMTAKAGEAAAHMARTGETPREVPEDMFSMKRFLSTVPLFSTDPKCNGLRKAGA